MYGLKSKKVFSPNECMVVKNLEYCRKLYYNGNRDKDVIWLTALTAKSYREFYDLIIQILNEKNVKKLMEAVVNMNKDEFILHEWQKEKLDALVKYNELEAAKKEGKALGISEGKNLGIIEGENNKTIQIVKNMLNIGIEIENIIKVTGLKEEEISKIKKSM